MNNYILVNPNISGFIKKQRGTNMLLGFCVGNLSIAVIALVNQLSRQQSEINQIKKTIREQECEKA